MWCAGSDRRRRTLQHRLVLVNGGAGVFYPGVDVGPGIADVRSETFNSAQTDAGHIADSAATHSAAAPTCRRRRRSHGTVCDGVADDGGNVVDFGAQHVVGHILGPDYTDADHSVDQSGRRNRLSIASVSSVVVEVARVVVVIVVVARRTGFVQVEVDVQDGPRSSSATHVVMVAGSGTV